LDLAPFLVLTRQKAKGQSPVRMARLTKNKEFQTVYKHGQVYVGRYVVLYVLPRPGQATRTGFTVGKKVGGAVKRNLVRRRLKEIQRQLQVQLKPGYDLVLVGRPRALTVGFWPLSEEVRRLCGQAGLLTDEGGQRNG
jgi:ribonuclease P protein component